MKRKDVAFNGTHFRGIAGETIVKMTYGAPEGWPYADNLRHYGAFTLYMASGRVFVITQGMGEVSVSEAVE